MDQKKLRKIRDKRGFTQAQVAAIAGMTQQAYARIETGNRTDPVLSTAESIADALGVSVDELRSKHSSRRKPQR